MKFQKEVKEPTSENITLYLTVENIKKLHELAKGKNESMNKVVNDLIKKA